MVDLKLVAAYLSILSKEDLLLYNEFCHKLLTNNDRTMQGNIFQTNRGERCLNESLGEPFITKCKKSIDVSDNRTNLLLRAHLINTESNISYIFLCLT